jgi:hypothetical protein
MSRIDIYLRLEENENKKKENRKKQDTRYKTR